MTRVRKAAVDYGLYLVTDAGLTDARLHEVVTAAISGGVGIVQLREKATPTRDFVDRARALVALLRPRGIPLLINDRVDVALAAGADGVHVGQSDMHVGDVRALMGPDAIVGLSVETPAQAKAAEHAPVDYLGVSPVFATATKPDAAPPWGVAGLCGLRRMTRHVLVGIGGIGPVNAAEVLHAGAEGIAVVSAICGAADPLAATRALRAVLDEVRVPVRI